jgi:hypothetical protein
MLVVNGSGHVIERMVTLFDQRCRLSADEAMTNAISSAEDFLSYDPKQASDILLQVRSFLPYTTDEIRQRWRSARRKASVKSVLSSIGFKASA